MAVANSILYIAEVDFPEADLKPFIEWYAYRHVADLFKAGFKSCASYGAVEGGMNVFDIYDLDSPDVFNIPAYRDMASKDPYDAHVMRNEIKEAATVYSQRIVPPTDAAGTIPMLDADWISMIRFEAPASADKDVISWLNDVEGPRLKKLGAAMIRFAYRSSDHPRVPSHRPRCLALAEWSERPAPAAASIDPLTKRFGSAVSNVDLYVGHRLYPWPNKPRT
jgi:hypothetical protein